MSAAVATRKRSKPKNVIQPRSGEAMYPTLMEPGQIKRAIQEELLRRYRNEDLPMADRIDARNQLVASFGPLVREMALKYSGGRMGRHVSDLIQEGHIAVMDGIERADLSRGSITTICYFRMQEMMNEYNSQMRGIIGLPRAAYRNVIHYVKFCRKDGGEGSIERFIKARGMNDRGASSFRSALAAVSLATYDVEYHDRSPEDIPAFEPDMRQEALREAMRSIPQRTREILHLVYFENRTLDQIARVYGITKERVRQIRNDGTDKLRRVLEGH